MAGPGDKKKTPEQREADRVVGEISERRKKSDAERAERMEVWNTAKGKNTKVAPDSSVVQKVKARVKEAFDRKRKPAEPQFGRRRSDTTAVDRIEGDKAVVEQVDGKFKDVPKGKLKEGDVLVNGHVDAGAKRARLEHVRKLAVKREK